MANENEVKDVEIVEVDPIEDNELIEETEQLDKEKDTLSESSSEEKLSDTTEDDDEDKGEKLVTHKESEEDKGIVEPVEELEIKRLPDETPREYALRLEVTRLKRGNREKRTQELLGKEKPSGISQIQYNELNDDDRNILAEYDTNELDTFEKILGVLAKKHGWVQREELKTIEKSQVSGSILDEFLQNHIEYLPENDKDNLLWNRFKEEFQIYKTPENPKDLKKIFNKIHRDIFGIKSEEGLKKIDAQKEKVKVASHSGGSANEVNLLPKQTKLTSEQRSHLKGFSEKDIEELGL